MNSFSNFFLPTSVTFASLNDLPFLSRISLPLIWHPLSSALNNKYYQFLQPHLIPHPFSLGKKNSSKNVLFISVIINLYLEENRHMADKRWWKGRLKLCFHSCGKYVSKALVHPLSFSQHKVSHLSDWAYGDLDYRMEPLIVIKQPV